MVIGVGVMRRIYRRKEEGIASTVGTIFALMIFTALLSMFMVQVVPVQIKDNEAEHDMHVLSQFSQLRSIVDILTLTKNTNYTAYIPIKLGAAGVPLVASDTYGQLSVYPTGINSTYLMSVEFTDSYGTFISQNASGSLQFIAPNRYYVPEMFAYENGAVVRYNYYSQNAIMPIEPNMKFVLSSTGVNVSLTLQQIYGYPITITGADTRSIGISLEGLETQTYNVGGNITIRIYDNYTYGSSYINLTKFWIHTIQSMLNYSGLIENTDYTIVGNAIILHNVYNVEIKMVYLNVVVGS